MLNLKNKLLFAASWLIMSACFGWTKAQDTSSDRPNIIVFMVDDMGWMDTSEPFYSETMPLNKKYHTPNMERLAKEGVKFVNAYAQAVCTPSRVSYLSGMNASRSRVTNWTSPFRNTTTDEPDDQFLPLEWNLNGMSPDPSTPRTVHATTFAKLLKDAGYYTIQIGKAHWGSNGTPGANPHNLGFMVNVAGHSGGHPQSYLSEEWYGNKPGKNQPQAVPDLEAYYDNDIFLTEALTREALKALKVPVERHTPFFLNMAQYALHTPIMADKRFVQKYEEAGLDPIEAKYASLVEGMDKSLGDLMDFLEQKNIAENTIIIFMSDNGGLDHHDRGGALNTNNAPLRSGKGSVYEGGIREPMMVKWPGVAKPHTISQAPVIIEDFFPSILEMAGIRQYEVVQNVDGQSFVPILRGGFADDSRPLVFHYPHKWIPLDPQEKLGINYYSALRWKNWKLLYSMRDRSFELYDLSKDIGETHDLAKKKPAKVKELAGILGKTLKRYQAQMPVERSTGKTVPYPDEIF